MTQKSHTPRRRGGLDPINIDELFNSPSNRGMLSFLERAPEEARLRLEERRRVDAAEADGTSLPLATKQEADALRDLSAVGMLHTEGELRAVETALETNDIISHPLSESPRVGTSPTERMSLPGQVTPGGESQSASRKPDTAVVANVQPNALSNAKAVPVGDLHTVGESRTQLEREPFWQTSGRMNSAREAPTVGNLPTAPLDGRLIGRRQKIRRANIAQDGHSTGEQLLYLSLWNAARPESSESRIITVGYQGMSVLCKLDKTNCKKNVQGLLEKLAVEIVDGYRSEERIGRTYRVFSYKEILRRREEAGMIWVVRTSGVRFVAIPNSLLPGGNSPMAPAGNLPPATLRNAPWVSKGELPRESVGDLPPEPVGETPTLLGKNRNSLQETSSDMPLGLPAKFREVLPSFDDDAARLLWVRCRQIAPDCTQEEIEYCFHVKAQQLLKGRKQIDNPVGMMIFSIPKTFEGPEALHLQRRREIERNRQAQEAEHQRSIAKWLEMLEDPRTSEADKAMLRQILARDR